MTPEFDNTQAASEGWAIFECSGSSNGPWQICRDDSPDDPKVTRLESDDAAWKLVWDRALAGSDYHKAALAYVLEHNPLEYACIARCNAPEGSPVRALANAIWVKACEIGSYPGAEDWPVTDTPLAAALIETARAA